MAGDDSKQEQKYELENNLDTFECRFTDLTHKDANENVESVFYFESDHLALKGNSDYYKLVKSVAVLESQRIKIVEVRYRLLIWKSLHLTLNFVFSLNLCLRVPDSVRYIVLCLILCPMSVVI